MEIRGQRILITGASRGIGKSFAEMCAKESAELILLSRNSDLEMKNSLLKMGAKSVEHRSVDLCSIEQVKDLTTQLKNVKIDILFNNAGQLTGGLLEEQPFDEIQSMLQVNLAALIFLSQAVLPQMLKRKSGKIINNSSVSGVMNLPCASTYSAAKAGVVAFTNCLQAELNNTGVSTLLLITPGIETRMYKEISVKYGKNFDLSFLQKPITTDVYANMIREAILNDIPVLKPQGVSGIGLSLAQHLPNIFNKFVSKKFKR